MRGSRTARHAELRRAGVCDGLTSLMASSPLVAAPRLRFAAALVWLGDAHLAAAALHRRRRVPRAVRAHVPGRCRRQRRAGPRLAADPAAESGGGVQHADQRRRHRGRGAGDRADGGGDRGRAGEQSLHASRHRAVHQRADQFRGDGAVRGDDGAGRVGHADVRLDAGARRVRAERRRERVDGAAHAVLAHPAAVLQFRVRVSEPDSIVDRISSTRCARSRRARGDIAATTRGGARRRADRRRLAQRHAEPRHGRVDGCGRRAAEPGARVPGRARRHAARRGTASRASWRTTPTSSRWIRTCWPSCRRGAPGSR